MAAKHGRRRAQGTESAQPPGNAIPPSDSRVLLLALVAVTIVSYAPAWFGGPLWDDNAHITAPHLRGSAGLWRIWTEFGATQQYYPVTHSAFWLMHRLWGDSTLGYHLTSIGLHAGSAALLCVLLSRLGVPGGFLAALVFALHPVQVESVAWISEIKNTLSGLLYLLAALVYFRFERTRRAADYVLMFALFVAALLSKSVTATLPAALLLVLWWQRGRLHWDRDVRPLVPMLIVGIGFGLLTARVEREHVGASGEIFDLSILERVLLAARACWFYITSLAWPHGLSFIYPRWEISANDPVLYLYLLAIAALLVWLWRMRVRSRAPLAAALFFGGTLVPALGFFNVYPFRYSFVADHFQYLASIGPIALVAASAAIALKRRARWVEPAVVVAIGLVLAGLTYRQSRAYADSETLYRRTLAVNPSCWMCLNNLAMMNLDRGGAAADSLAQVEQALRLNRRVGEVHDNHGVLLRLSGRRAEALAAHQEAVRLAPDMPRAHYNLAVELQAAGRPAEALAHYEQAARLLPTFVEAHNGAGALLQMMGRVNDAIAHITAALEVRPDDPAGHDNLATAYARAGQFDQAISHYQRALQLDPGYVSARSNLATAYASTGRLPEAITEYEQVVRLAPQDPRALDNLAFALLQAGRIAEAIATAQAAVRIGPGHTAARVTLGIALAAGGRHAEAITHLQQALERPDLVNPAQVHAELARAYERSGNQELARKHYAMASGR